MYVLTKHEFFLGWGYTRNNCALRIKNMCIKGVSRAKGGGVKGRLEYFRKSIRLGTLTRP